MSKRGQQPAKIRVTYDSENDLSADGRSYSRETTIWHGLGHDNAPRQAGGEEPRGLAAACQRAARIYPRYVGRLFLHILGVRGDAADASQSIYIRPIGPTILELGRLRREPPHDYFYPVVGGLLAIVESEEGWDGKLVFRWYREAGQEIFETELREFRPFLAGRQARSPLRRWLYRFTQTRLHTFVMWMFHKWVRKNRGELLRAYEEIEG